MPRRKKPFKETDLYPPLKKYLETNGYRVRSEVKHCDIVASKDDDFIVIEMKRHLSIDLLIQATKRQSLTGSVYVAIPRPADMGRRSRWSGVRRLLRQLSLGLILVSLDNSAALVEVMFHPIPHKRKKGGKARRAVLREIGKRSDDYNMGGSTGRKLVTAYRENAIQIACYLEKLGPSTPKALRALETGGKTLSILSSNFYGWFERIARGVYDLTPTGVEALKEYPDLLSLYRSKFEESAVSATHPQA